MAEYRLDDLARISGVSARNIRAYRERGLLDPPRRVGRSAYYDDYHLSQLRTINQLHRKGFNSAHIAEFFASMRDGADLADILGIRRAVLGPGAGADDDEDATAAPIAGGRRAIAIDHDSDEARRMIDYGLAEMRDGALVAVDATIGQVLGRTPDQLLYVRALLRIHESTRTAIDSLAGAFVEAVQECVRVRFGDNYAPTPGERNEFNQVMQDCRDLWRSVVSERLDTSVQQRMATGSPGFTAGILLSGRRERTAR